MPVSFSVSLLIFKVLDSPSWSDD